MHGSRIAWPGPAIASLNVSRTAWPTAGRGRWNVGVRTAREQLDALEKWLQVAQSRHMLPTMCPTTRTPMRGAANHASLIPFMMVAAAVTPGVIPTVPGLLSKGLAVR